VLGSITNIIPALGSYPIDIAANVVSACLIAYAILRYQLLDITVVVRKGLLCSIPTAIIGTGYFLIISLAIRLFHAFAGPQIILLSLLVAAITAVVAQPLRDKVQSRIDRLFFREKYDSSLMLQRLSDAVASILDLDRLTNMILDEVTTTMHVERAAFFLKQDKSEESRLIAQRGMDQNADLRLGKDHPIVEWLSNNGHALTRHDVEVMPQFKALWGEERKDLERIGAELFLPLKAEGELVGLLAVGPKLSEEAYSHDDQLTLTTLANQVAIAIENARLYKVAQRELTERKQAEEGLKRSFEGLQRTLEGTIDALASAVDLCHCQGYGSSRGADRGNPHGRAGP
jgi:sigma-B regulation protein RsbU (phosphoserine phosphatase)